MSARSFYAREKEASVYVRVFAKIGLPRDTRLTKVVKFLTRENGTNESLHEKRIWNNLT